MAQTIDVRVAENGRMIVSQGVGKAMGLRGDTKVGLTLDDVMRLSPVGHGVSRAQALYRHHAKTARTTDDFLADRRDEADPAARAEPPAGKANGHRPSSTRLL